MDVGTATTHGLALVLIAWLLFACQDAGSKQLAQSYSVIQILWVRFLSLAVVTGWLVGRHGMASSFRTDHVWLQALRSLLLVTEIGLFILTITILPLASAHAIMAAAPLIVTALSVPLLGERVGIRRWCAIGIAFVGVLIILRPGLGMVHPIALLTLLAAFMWALYQVLTRIVGRSDPPLVTLFYTALFGAAGLSVLGPFFWRTPDARGWALLAMVAILSAAGHFCLIKALQLTSAALLQPFAYTVLVWATLVGFVVFGNLPDLATVVGGAIVVASGLYTFAREHRRRASF